MYLAFSEPVAMTSPLAASPVWSLHKCSKSSPVNCFIFANTVNVQYKLRYILWQYLIRKIRGEAVGKYRIRLC